MNSCEDPPKNSYPVHVSLASGDCEQCGVCRKNLGTQGWLERKKWIGEMCIWR